LSQARATVDEVKAELGSVRAAGERAASKNSERLRQLSAEAEEAAREASAVAGVERAALEARLDAAASALRSLQVCWKIRGGRGYGDEGIEGKVYICVSVREGGRETKGAR